MACLALLPVPCAISCSEEPCSSSSSLICSIRYPPYPRPLRHKLVGLAGSRPIYGRVLDLKDSTCGSARAFAMGIAEEAQLPINGGLKSFFLPEASPPTNNADDMSLHNPLLRLHRMGCGWLGVILEWDGVIVEDDGKLECQAWCALAEEEGKSPPPQFILKKVEGMKSEQAISEVLCWSRNPREFKRLAQRKEHLFQEIQGDIYRLKAGSCELLTSLKKHSISAAVASTRLRKPVEKAMGMLGLEGVFNAIVTAEDVRRAKPDPEMYMYAAQLLNIIPERCIVIGNSNASIEAAHEAYMKCIGVTGRHPRYELCAADLVVTRLDMLSIVDLKNLADLSSPEFQPPAPDPEPELEEESAPQRQAAIRSW